MAVVTSIAPVLCDAARQHASRHRSEIQTSELRLLLEAESRLKLDLLARQ